MHDALYLGKLFDSWLTTCPVMLCRYAYGYSIVRYFLKGKLCYIKIFFSVLMFHINLYKGIKSTEFKITCIYFCVLLMDSYIPTEHVQCVHVNVLTVEMWHCHWKKSENHWLISSVSKLGESFSCHGWHYGSINVVCPDPSVAKSLKDKPVATDPSAWSVFEDVQMVKDIHYWVWAEMKSLKQWTHT